MFTNRSGQFGGSHAAGQCTKHDGPYTELKLTHIHRESDEICFLKGVDDGGQVEVTVQVESLKTWSGFEHQPRQFLDGSTLVNHYGDYRSTTQRK